MNKEKKPSPNPNGRPKQIDDAVRVDVRLSRKQKEFAQNQPEGMNAFIRNLIAREMENKQQ